MTVDRGYLKDGIWYGSEHPPAQFVGTVRYGKKEWTKTEPTPKGRNYKGGPAGHQCCPCPACAAWEAIWCPDRQQRYDGRLFA